MGEFHDEKTFSKVYNALHGEALPGEEWRMCMNTSDVDEAIRRMQSAGILFREYRDDVRETWVGETTTEFNIEVEPVDENGEYAPLKKEEYLRITALEAAINSAVRGAANVELLTARADLFVDYIKRGSQYA